MPELIVGEALRGMLAGLGRELTRSRGPVKWCSRCGRKHGRRQPCDLVRVGVEAKSGRMVERQVHRSRARS